MPRLPLHRLMGTAAMVALPLAAGGGVLLLSGKIWLAAGVGGVLVAVVAVLLLRRPFDDMQAVAAHARELARGGDSRPPLLSSWGVSTDLAGAIADLQRSWRKRTTEFNSLLVFNDIVLDNLPAPLLLLAEDRRVVRANSAARQLFGGEIKDRDLATVLRAPAVLEAVDAALAGEPGRDVVLSLPVPLERDFRVRVEPLPHRPDEGTGILLVLIDVTAIVRTEQMRVDFIANVSHELRTPLATLSGFIETLQGPARDDTEARDRFLVIMHEQAARMTRLVSDLLSLTRIEMNEHTRPEGQVGARETLTHVASALEPQARTRGVSLVLDIAEGLPPLTGDADELTQVFTNLLDNAVKYGRPGTAVEIVARREERGPASMPGGSARPVLSVAVRDHGEGMGKAHLPRLTERFYRVDAARSREMGGTGLGLAIVKHVVSRHRGTMVIDSEIGQGSVFTVYLPVDI